MKSTLVIGYGNPLRGDDGIGWAAAERLAQNPVDQIQVEASHQLTPELAAQVARVDRLILIDASTQGIAGSITVQKVESFSPPPTTFSHQLDPAALVACAQQLYGASPEAWLVTVSGESFEHGGALSPAVAAVLPEIVSCVYKLAES